MKGSLKPLDQQVVVITGASSGIGLATALAAAREGARVVLAARSADTLEQIATHIRAQGGDALAVRTDVAVRADVANLAREAVARYGAIHTWINDAGVSIYGRLDEVDDEASRQLFDTNFWGTVHGALVALPYLRQSGGGALINIGSEASEAAVPLQGMYSASKHAVKGFTDALRAELDADEAPVSVTLIQPTAVDTPYSDHAGNYLQGEPKLPTPMIEPEKVASAILDAAVSPTRSTKVGTMSVINTTVAKILPALGEMMGRMQIGRQERDETPHPQEGTLYEPGEVAGVGGQGRTHGRGDENAADSGAAKERNLRRA